MYATLVNAGEGDPRSEVAFDTTTLRPHNYGKRRVGQPRRNWVVETAKEYWNSRVKETHRGVAVGELNWDNDRHREMVRETAELDAQKLRQLRMARRR